MKRKRALALLAALLICTPGFGAAPFMDELEAHVGIYTIGNYTTGSGLSSPLYLLGTSMVFDPETMPDPWVFGLGIDLMGSWYEWNDTDRRADLSEPEAGHSFFTVGMLLSPRIGARFPLGEAVAMGAFFGLDLLVRFPFDPFSSVPFSDEQLPALVYFVAGQFLYPEIGGWLTWQITKDVELAFALRSLWPVYRVWSPEVIGFSTFLHQVVFAGTLGMTIDLGNPGSVEKPAAP